MGGIAAVAVCVLRLTVGGFTTLALSRLSCSDFLRLPAVATVSAFCLVGTLATRLVAPLIALSCALDDAAALVLSVGGGTPLCDGSVSSLWVVCVCVASIESSASPRLGGGAPAVEALLAA